MTDQKLSALPTANSPLNSGDLVYVVQGGVSKQALVSAFPTGGGGGGGFAGYTEDIINANAGVVTGDSGYVTVTWTIDIAPTDVLTNYFRIILPSTPNHGSSGYASYTFNITINITPAPTVGVPIYFSLEAPWYTNQTDYPGAGSWLLALQYNGSTSFEDFFTIQIGNLGSPLPFFGFLGVETDFSETWLMSVYDIATLEDLPPAFVPSQTILTNTFTYSLSTLQAGATLVVEPGGGVYGFQQILLPGGNPALNVGSKIRVLYAPNGHGVIGVSSVPIPSGVILELGSPEDNFIYINSMLYGYGQYGDIEVLSFPGGLYNTAIWGFMTYVPNIYPVSLNGKLWNPPRYSDPTSSYANIILSSFATLGSIPLNTNGEYFAEVNYDWAGAGNDGGSVTFVNASPTSPGGPNELVINLTGSPNNTVNDAKQFIVDLTNPSGGFFSITSMAYTVPNYTGGPIPMTITGPGTGHLIYVYFVANPMTTDGVGSMTSGYNSGLTAVAYKS